MRWRRRRPQAEGLAAWRSLPGGPCGPRVPACRAGRPPHTAPPEHRYRRGDRAVRRRRRPGRTQARHADPAPPSPPGLISPSRMATNDADFRVTLDLLIWPRSMTIRCGTAWMPRSPPRSARSATKPLPLGDFPLRLLQLRAYCYRYGCAKRPWSNSYPVMQRPRSPACGRTTAWPARRQLMHCMSFRMPGSYTGSPDSATTSALTSFPSFANRAASFRTVSQAATTRCLPGLRYLLSPRGGCRPECITW